MKAHFNSDGFRYSDIHIPTNSSITISFGSELFHSLVNISETTTPKKKIPNVSKEIQNALV